MQKNIKQSKQITRPLNELDRVKQQLISINTNNQTIQNFYNQFLKRMQHKSKQVQKEKKKKKENQDDQTQKREKKQRKLKRENQQANQTQKIQKKKEKKQKKDKMFKISSYGLFTIYNFRQNNGINYVSGSQDSDSEDDSQDDSDSDFNSDEEQLKQLKKQKILKERIEENKENRQKIQFHINSMQYIQKLKFNPSVFLEQDILTRISNIEVKVKQQAKYHLEKTDSSNFSRFMELFNITETFKQMDKNSLYLIYQNKRNLLVEQYKKVYQGYVSLNRQVSTNKQQIQIHQTIYFHLQKFYFKTWEQSLLLYVNQNMIGQGIDTKPDVIFESLKLQIQQFNKILKQYQSVSRDLQLKNNNFQTQKHKDQQNKIRLLQLKQKIQSSFFNTKSVPNINNIQLLKRMQVGFFEFKKRLQFSQTYFERVLSYFFQLIKVIDKKQSRIKNQIEKIKQIQRELSSKPYDIYLKDSIKYIINQKVYSKKILNITENQHLNLSERIFFEILILNKSNKLKSIYIEKKDQQIFIKTCYYLELLSRQNYQNRLSLENKANQIFHNDNLIITNRSLRLNYYGQCYYQRQVKLSQILNVNSRKQSNGFYTFLEFKDVRIYCNQIIFDIENIFIICKSSFNIFARKITLQKQNYSIAVRTFDKLNATLIIFSRTQMKDQSLKSKLKKAYEIGLDYKKVNASNIDKNKLVSSFIVSRTRLDGPLFLQKFQETPYFQYLINQKIQLQNQKIIKRRYSTQKMLQFGQLHLQKMIILQKNHREKLDEEMFIQSQFEQQIIEYIISKFNNTSIKLRYQLFSTSFCDKLAMLINSKNNNLKRIQKNQDLKKEFMQECCIMIKDHLFSHIYKYVNNQISDQKYGRHYVFQAQKQSQNTLKKYCDDLLSISLTQFEKNMKNEDLLSSITKKFVSQFESKILFAAQQHLSILGKIGGFIKTTVMKLFNQDDKIIKINRYKFVKSLVRRQQIRRSHFAQEAEDPDPQDLIEYQENQQQHIRTQSSFIGLSEYGGDNKIETLEKLREQIIEKIKDHEYQYVIKQYETNLGGKYNVFSDKLDSTHSEFAYVYMKTLNFQKAQQELLLLPEKDLFNKHKILFDVIKQKYLNIEEIINQKKIKNYIEANMTRYYSNPFKNNSKYQQNQYIIDSMKRKKQSTSPNYNIISFDSTKYNDDVINIIFAAQIEKYTHRPIMHLFDCIVCKNSSAFIGSVLATSRRNQKQQIQQQYKYPQYSANEFISRASIILDEMDDNIQLKSNIQRMKFQQLPIDLVMVQKNKGSKNIIYSQKNNSYSLNKQRIKGNVLYDFLLSTAKAKGQQNITNPLFDMYDPQHLPVLEPKSNKKINIVSLGATRLKNEEIIQLAPCGFGSKPWSKMQRWQIALDKHTKRQNLTNQDYIQHARMFLQQKWIQNSKQMRDFFDQLEDRPLKSD